MQGDDGTSSALAFIVAGVLFLAAVAALLFTVENEVPSSEDVETGYHAHAEAVLALLVESPGVGWNGTNWTGAYRPSLVEELRVLNASRLTAWRACGSHPCLVYSDVKARLGLGTLSFNATVTDANGTLLASFGPAPPLTNLDQAADAASVPVRHESLAGDYTVKVSVFPPSGV